MRTGTETPTAIEPTRAADGVGPITLKRLIETLGLITILVIGAVVLGSGDANLSSRCRSSVQFPAARQSASTSIAPR